MVPDQGIILYCHCAYSRCVPGEVKSAVLRHLADSGVPMEAVPDLCELSARRDPAMPRFARLAREGWGLRIIACFPRAVRWLFHAAGAALPQRRKGREGSEGPEERKASEASEGSLLVLNMKRLTAEAIVESLRDSASGGKPGGAARGASPERPGEASPERPRGAAGEGGPPSLRVVLYEGPGAEPLEPDERLSLMKGLLGLGYRVICTGTGGRFEMDGAAAVVLGRFGPSGPPPACLPGAGRGDLGAAAPGLACRSIAGLGAAEVLRQVESAREELGLAPPGEWIPWFPVIDYDRCADCRQCASFCLFGVYRVDEAGKVRVVSPAKCKTDCPACARLCGQAAIMFPKYGDPPINGEEVTEDVLRRHRAGVEAAGALRSNVYAALRLRGAAP